MFQITEFMKKLDELYQKKQFSGIESYLNNGINDALGRHDEGTALILLNELMGYYRSVSRHADCAEAAEKALALIRAMGLEGTVNHGTTLLNAATGLRAAGEKDRAEEACRKAKAILESQLPAEDYRLASLYNNMSLLYAAMGRLELAAEYARKALERIEQNPDAQAELAISLSNLGGMYTRLGQSERAHRCLERAVRLFEQLPGGDDPHYPAALCALAELHFHQGEPEKSAELFRRALGLIERTYGRNDDWQTTRRNLAAAEDLIARRNAVKNKTGMELAREFYEQAGRPMLQQKYPEYACRIAAGLVGEGAECLGFDDAFSVDHDFGPGFCLWLTREDYQAIGSRLQADYQALAARWPGAPARNVTPEGTNRVGVMEIDEFFRRFTGHTHAPKADSWQDIMTWNAIPTDRLASAVNGQVFEDPLGEFTRRREEFARYPEPVRLCRLGQALGRMAQAGQYNYPRAKKRQDADMMYACLAEFVSAAQETAYLLDETYMPFYKWRARGMERLEYAGSLIPLLHRLMERPAADGQAEETIEAVCACIAAELKRQGLASVEDTFLEYHKREVLQRMQQMLQNDGAEKECASMPSKKAARIAAIVDEEWRQFQQVQNEGGRASCQDDRDTFGLMRTSQFTPWAEEVLASYQQDLKRAGEEGWNLLTEKYARMMEHTAPQQYARLADRLPERSAERLQLQELLISIMMRWTREVERRCPHLMGRGRNLSSEQDGPWNVSSETYLRGELGTYSDETLRLYAQMVLELLSQGKNLVEQNMTCMARGYGYRSLEDAENACAAQACTGRP
ncbi:DUF4125 family protein [Allofournierella massiliensis]|uniref:Tetratricopeptide repeat protein n=1 Tax=Allofournierella massiliensis TaxID=1650663 RepID=A0A4R1QW17_9FIRM|nr:DUF4125 family protein [Fournierella massiliensis]TCL57411.1 tetratricopeptide repeat protein [Fournierella massiliensis]